MDHLSKQQLILLALLVSFVTSLATGIVTVSLMDQAPSGVTRTVSQVIQQTIQQALPESASVASAPISIQDQAASAVSTVSAGLVEVRRDSDNVRTGLAMVVDNDGFMITDKSSVDGSSSYSVFTADGRKIPIAVIQVQVAGDVAFLVPQTPIASTSPAALTPVAFAQTPRLGQTVLSLSGALTGTSTPTLGQGIITSLDIPASPADLSGEGRIGTNIPVSQGKTISGSPLFDLSGAVVGIRTASLSGSDPVSFYPISQLRAAIPKLK